MSANNSKQSSPPPLAVVGLSALFPKAANLDEFWSNIRRGVNAITEVPSTHWSPDEYFDANQKTPDMTYARRGGFLSPIPFDPLEFGISPNNLEAIDTSQLLGLVGAKRALEHAGYGAGRQFDRSRVGCILGVTGTLEMVIPLGARLGHPRWRKALKDAGVPDEVAEDVVNRISQSYVPWQENSFPGLLGNVVAGRIANRLDLHGTNCVVDAACASSLSAIHLAALELWTGRSDMVVTGGIDTFNDIFMFMCFSKTPALSPTGDAKPFSDAADGTILGEGVGIVVLKRLADAERDNDRIYALIKGIGTSSDGAGNAVYAPKAEGQVRCLEDAYRTAGVSPATIELVEAHGTGTKVGDATEVSALMQVYKGAGRRGTWCAIGSVKSQIGHTKAAAGAAGVIKAILALQHQVLPPTVKVNRPPAAFLAEDCPFYVNTEARPWLKPKGYPRRAAISAFGFGGSNFHCVLEESPQTFDEPEWDGDAQVITLSGSSPEELANQLRSNLLTKTTAEWQSVRTYAASCRKSYDVNHACRLTLVVERDKTDLNKLATSALTMLERYPAKTAWTTPDGAYFGRGKADGKLGVLFPGQGAQYVGMLRELMCRFPVMQSILADANEVFSTSGAENGATKRLSDYIYPHPVFSTEDRDQQELQLRATQIAQPAIGAVSLGVLTVLDRFGVRPEAVAGHSYGELTALCASSRFSPESLYRLSALRGRLMAAAQENDGGMLAVLAPLAQIETALKELSLDLVVANHNSPTQVVLSGRIPDIDRAASLFASRNIRGKKLPVAAAFHSPLVAPASDEFRPVLDEIDFQPSSMPVYANSTATEYPNDPAAARDLLANQLAQPVQFVREIEQMYRDGVRTFLEVGPSGILTGLVNSILDGKEFRAIATDSSGGKRSGVIDLAHSLANLSSAGYAISWKLWDPDATDPAETSSRRLQIPISGANYVKPRDPIPPRAAQAWPTATDSPTIQSDSRSDRDEIANSGVSSMVDSHRPISESESSKTDRPSTPPTGAPSIGDASVAETLQAIRETLRALQEMQQETSKLHQHFLDGQASALQALSKIAGQKLSGVDPSQPDTLPLPNVRAEMPSFVEQQRSAHLEPPARFAPEPTPTAAIELPAIDWQTNPLTGESLNSVNEPIADQFPATPTFTTASIEPPAPPARPIPAASTASAAHSSLAATVLAVVSEKTGYPTEMLNLEMSLDHDLGIDSIKRVEILSALQERVPELPAFQPEELGALHTLNDVVSLADARTTGGYRLNSAPAPTSLAPTQVSAPAPVKTPIAPPVATIPAAPAPKSQQSSLSGTVLEVVAEKTGYPIEMLNLEMSLDHDLGIDSIKRVEILSALQERVPQLPAFQPEELGSLHTLNDVVSLADARTSGGHQTNHSPAQTFSAPAHLPAPMTTAMASPAAAVPAAPAPKSQQSSLSGTVLEVVAEKTGYPIEMLNLEMSLDHDLGIDSIKRVEILSALQERVPELPAFQPEELGSLHTLNDVVTLADSRTSRKASPTPAAPTAARSEAPRSPAPFPGPAPAPPASQQPVVAAPSVPKKTSATAADLNRSVIRSVPISSAASRPSIPLFPGSEVWVTEDGLGLSLLVANHLTDQGFKPRIIDLDEPPVGAIPEGLAGLILIAPERGMDQQQLWHSIEWLQKVGPTLRKVGQASAAVVVTVSRIDGFFGFESKKRLRDTVSGGLAGLAKCVHLEWPEVTARAIDLGPQWSAPHVAAAMLVTEMLHEGPVEVGLTTSGPTTLEVVEDELTGQFETPPVRAGEVVVVTGGARGVTAEAAVAMAHAWQPHLVILGRSPELAREPDWLTHLQTEAEIKKALITQMPAGTAPRAVASECKEILAGREIARNLQRMRDAGSSVTYRCVDVRNANAVRPVLEEVRRDIGEIRGLIHGAGVLADQRIEDKTKDQFERVYDTKVGGFETLLNCIDSNALRMLGIFSSYTARYGRVGQVDYAIANEVLNKQARLFANLHPNCRVTSFNWGPWDGGMVSNDGLKKLFASEGVGLIPTDAGADAVVRELCQTTNRPVEVLLLAKTEDDSPPPPTRPTPSPAVMQPPTAASQMGSVASFSPPAATSTPAPTPANMFAVSRSAKAVVAAANQLLTNSPQSSAKAVSIDQITHTPPLDTDNFRVAFERELNIEGNPVLQSHVIGGKAVLPVAVMLEWLAHGAIHGNPGLELRGLDDFRVYQGVRLGARDSIQLQVLAGKLHRDDLYYKVPMRMVSRTNDRDVVHAAATVVLAPGYPSTPAPTLHIPMLRPYSMDVDTAYSTRLFHGSKLHGITSIEGCSPEGIVVTSKLAPVSSLWMANPVRTKWLADPLVIDAALQAVILWSQETRNKPCLPCAITKYRQFRRALPRDGVKIIIRVLPGTEQTIRCEIEFVDMLGLLIARMEGCESIADATLASAFQKNRIDA